jgi:class 3 adenylate cyclase
LDESLAEFRSIVRGLSPDHGIRVGKWLGDGCMFIGTEVKPIVETVLDLSQQMENANIALPLRIGVAAGKVIVFEGDDYIGSAVNLAARLCDASGPFEVLLPANQLEDLPDGAVATPHGLVSLRGFSDPIEVVELSGTPTPADRHDTGELWTRSPFVA